MDNVDNRPAVWRRRGRPRAVLLPRVQRSPFRWTYHPPRPFRAVGGQSPKASTQHRRGGCSVQTARPNIDNVDNMDTDGRRVEAIQARGGEYRKSKRPPPTNRERPKPQIKNERPKEQRARLCTNIQHEAKRNNRHALRLYGASRQEPKRYAPTIRPRLHLEEEQTTRTARGLFQESRHNVDTLQRRRAAVRIVHRAKHSTPRKVFPTNQTRALFCPSQSR